MKPLPKFEYHAPLTLDGALGLLAELEKVKPIIEERFGSIPFDLVKGPVRRPGWLVEIEGLAVTDQHNPSLPPF